MAAILWSFGAGVWFSTTINHIISRKPGAAVFAALVTALYIVIAIAVLT